MKPVSPRLVFALLIALAYTLTTSAQLRAISRPEAGSTDGAFKKLLGDGRRLFAGQFVELADVYFHSGYYPSIFDRRDAQAVKAVTSQAKDHDDHEEHDHNAHQHDENGKCIAPENHQDEHEKAMDFIVPPSNWLEGFIRRFRITEHTHLEKGEEREILPWLKLAIELDPQVIDTYTTTSYWLRKSLSKPKEAEEVLREGLRNNPKSSEILFELGRLYRENYQDAKRAENAWHSALRLWRQQGDEAKNASLSLFGEITGNLARLEVDAGNWPRAIQYFQLAKQASPNPAAIEKQIAELTAKLGLPTNSVPALLPLP